MKRNICFLRTISIVCNIHVMMAAIVLLLITATATALGQELFPKCCGIGSSLVRVSDSAIDEQFKCESSGDLALNYNSDSLPLMVGRDVSIKQGLPECDVLDASPVERLVTVTGNNCVDKLSLEVINGSIQNSKPRMVELNCSGENNQGTVTYPIRHYRKCCPQDETYDRTYHLCRKTIRPSDIQDLMNELNVENDHIYEIEYKLTCKHEEYAMELSEQEFTFSLQDGLLTAVAFSENSEMFEFIEDDWCVERAYNGGEMLVRGCSDQCTSTGALCLRKCCPLGYAYRPIMCGSSRSDCVPYHDEEALFDLSYYLHDRDTTPSAIGIQSWLLSCRQGKFMLNRSEEPHYLGANGDLIHPLGNYDITHDYCIETFDRRHCNGSVSVETLLCFVDFEANQNKNYFVSFVTITVSCVFLALTLLVYCLLPELRNLHGRTLICHIATMLLAMTCLATVQFKLVRNNVLCQILGYGIYFGFVAAFSWLNVMCLDIWWTFGSVRSIQPLRKASTERRRFIWYSLYAWSLAVTLTLTMFLLDRYPVADFLDANIGKNKCWFGSLQYSSTNWPHYIFFVIPMGLLTCTNFVLWLLTARHCNRVKSEVHRLQAGSKGDQIKRRFRGDQARYVLTGKLWVVMGASWISELLSTLISEPQWLWFVIDRINELQGVSMFVVLVLKPKLYYLIRKKLGLDPVETRNNGPSSGGRTSSSLLSRSISTDERNSRISSNPQGTKQNKNI